MKDDLGIANYCTCFIDLLGQRAALKGQTILPDLDVISEDEKARFLDVVRDSVGAIGNLQARAESFTRSTNLEPSSLIASLPEAGQEIFKKIRETKPKQQRWSDGLVYYASLEDLDDKCPMNAVVNIFIIAGSLCFLSLAGETPARGAIEIAWGVELHENELYGAAVANSYILESEVAQYPRMVVGEQTVKYLEELSDVDNTADDMGKKHSKSMASLCLKMLAVDYDGVYIIDYLGETFQECIGGVSITSELYRLANGFVGGQYETHKKNKNTKLATRYTLLRAYFHQNKKNHVV